MLRTSLSTGSSENIPTTVAVEYDEVESGGGGGGADETDEISAKSKNMKNLQKPDVWNNLLS